MDKEQQKDKIKDELNSFKSIWQGGYYENDPLDPMAVSSYGVLGYVSVLHVVYLTCVKPYINNGSVVLEIGPGRGSWTKTFLKAKEIWCLDALSAEHNKFWQYIGSTEKIRYFQVSDFGCSQLPDSKFNYLFSFGTFCHISFEGITEYMRNIYPKLTSGAHCFIMIADYDKYNSALRRADNLTAFRILENRLVSRYIFKPLWFLLKNKFISKPLDTNEDDVARSGRWYNTKTDRFCTMLEKIGFRVIDPDMDILLRDPMVHFVKP